MDNISVALACTVLGAVISFLSFQRSKGHDIRTDTKEGAETKAKLDYIATAVDEIRLDNKARDREVSNLNERLIRVEESTKSAHHRINAIEEKGEM